MHPLQYKLKIQLILFFSLFRPMFAIVLKSERPRGCLLNYEQCNCIFAYCIETECHKEQVHLSASRVSTSEVEVRQF